MTWKPELDDLERRRRLALSKGRAAQSRDRRRARRRSRQKFSSLHVQVLRESSARY